MDVVCDKCSTKIKIPDKKIQKIPKGQVFSIACPKCKNKLSVKNEPAASPPKAAPGKPAKAAPPKTEKPAPPPDEPSGTDDDDASSGSPFEFLEEGAKTAMICDTDAGRRAKIRAALENMDYHVSEADSHREALKQMRFHEFTLIVINEMFGTRDPDMNHVLRHLEQLPMITRREMFIALLTSRFRTMDRMMSFNKSVNLVINLKDINDVEKIIGRGVRDNDNFYRVYKEMLKKFK
ncbi:hypothetical protein QUF72_22760 [Desulfobacterales bacterium HSG2]|nr:hypothetical protein [Desulfobacterales bacterium HSG2]